ncbi:unnamed protein product [Rotaria socialis]|uniref:Uncharacterized protein n=1 Tax=Rotaria socialis TaxID=392032 RepID=A0A818N907_9BILA|nr:unnamed protein product [Rotaria socialis]CAF3493043.1 unnamed protein product [Rotaria socialis]CAF3601538.1 unnamed protein product [Rotaria socialis]CAF3611009.1 unnamed protein product [Rotaria socialis]CAF4113545.1 unnamed protein product [Rotaria socialis]
MLLNSAAQHRVKHFNLLLARELSYIERTHSQNLMSHQKLENSIRRANNQILNNNRTKICMPFDNIYNEQTESIDYHKMRINDQININGNTNTNTANTTIITATANSNNNNIANYNHNNPNLKRRLSIGGSSTISQNQANFDPIVDEFSDDTSSFISLRRRRFCTKSQRLPPIVKATISTRHKREPKNQQWVTNLPQSNNNNNNNNNKSKDDVHEHLTMLNDESLKSTLTELTPIQRQVRSFLETLPTYKGAQNGFDSFGPASLYTNRSPVAIR